MFLKPTSCQKCHKAPATVKITRIIKGEVNEMHLCQECAAEISPYQMKMNMMQKELKEIFETLLKQAGQEETPDIPEEESAAHPAPASKPKVDTICDVCGFPFETYRKSFFLGCSHCYSVFREHLVPEIRKIHGSLQHTGRIPVRFQKMIEIQREIETMKRELQEAVRIEDFAKAALIRDRMKEMSREQGEG
ncbi:MAG TPA: UvrB/UvrC motif-containing protein [Candidatus Sumerlaeota bacterium]|nr:UvrB/UvrC motif-containing protein [Candidatus Sumerlaeota bacterium]